MRNKHGRLVEAVARNRARLALEKEKRRRAEELIGYRTDPVGYAQKKLGMEPWKKQRMILEAINRPPYRVMVESANGVGKTACVGMEVAHHFDCWNPGITIVTSPRAEQIERVTFKEIRRHLGGRPGLAPAAAFLNHTPNHFIHGSTAVNATAFEGHHDASLLFIFEEATGIEPPFWEAVRGMAAGGKARWLAILNPTNTDSQAYQERSAVYPDGSKQWVIFRICAFEHPNVLLNLEWLPGVYAETDPGDGRLMRALDRISESNLIDGAVDLRGIVQNLTTDETWGSWVEEVNFDPETDVDLWDGKEYELGPGLLPPHLLAGAQIAFPMRYWHPGPLGEARLLGRYPSQGLYSVFDEMMFQKCKGNALHPGDPDMPEIGCDVARYGDDKTVAVVQRSGRFLRMEKRAKQGTNLTAELLKKLCHEFAEPLGLDPRRVPVRVDDSGIGGGVVDQAADYNFIPVIAQSTDVMQPHLYKDRRSEILFHLKDRMVEGGVDLELMDQQDVAEVVRQATKIAWKPDSESRRRVLSKQQVKDKLSGRSPDELDALGLAYYRWGSGGGPKIVVPDVSRPPMHRREFSSSTSRLYGAR